MVGVAQVDSTLSKPQLIVPNTLQAHPFGLYFGRIGHNFKQKATKKINLNFNLSYKDVWPPSMMVLLFESMKTINNIKNLQTYFWIWFMEISKGVKKIITRVSYSTSIWSSLFNDYSNTNN